MLHSHHSLETFEWHAVATLATWGMTLVIQRAEHRDTQAIQRNKMKSCMHLVTPETKSRRSLRRSSNGESTCVRTISAQADEPPLSVTSDKVLNSRSPANAPQASPDRRRLRDRQDRSDYTVCSGEWEVGRIYDTRSGPESMRWC